MIEGLIPERVAEWLTAIATDVEPPNVIVEIGSFKGKSTVALASEARTTVYAIDPWDLDGNPSGRFHFASPSTFDAFLANTRELDNIEPIRGFSVEVAATWRAKVGAPIGLLFIDGDHRESAVLADWYAWRPHLADEALVVFDDYVSETGRSPGVQRAVNQIGIPFDVRLQRLAVMSP